MSGGDRRSAPEGRNGPASITAPLELRFGPSLLKRAHMMVLLGPVVVACAAALPVLLWNDDRSLADLLAAAWAALAEGSLSERVNGWAGVVLMPLGIVALVATRAARLRVSMTGLQGQLSPWSGAGIQKLTTGAFSIPWDRIESVSLISRGQGLNGIAHLNTARLIISTSDGEFTFAPFHWVARDDDHRLTLGEAFTGGRISASEWLARSPLVRSLRERGFEVEHDTGPRAEALTRGFDLARHRGMVVQMSLMALLGGYALIDGFATSPYRVLETLPAAAFAAAAIVGTALAAALGRGAPAKERMGVGILTVAALVSAVHPALVRVNAWTGTPRTVSYTVSAPGRLQAPGETFPDIDLTDMNIPEYWEAHSAGTEQPMTLVKGALGFEQWDERPLLERVRAFYVAKRRQESAATGEQGLQ